MPVPSSVEDLLCLFPWILGDSIRPEVRIFLHVSLESSHQSGDLYLEGGLIHRWLGLAACRFFLHPADEAL